MYSVMTFVQTASVARAAAAAPDVAGVDARIIVATTTALGPARLIRADVVDVKRMCVLLGWWCDRQAI
jgi:hypothetical protein